MNRFKQYVERKKQEYEKLITRLEKQAFNGIKSTEAELEELDRYNRNIKTAERLAENHEVNQRISDSELRFLTYDSDIDRPEFEDEVYNKIRSAISQTKDLTTDEINRLQEYLPTDNKCTIFNIQNPQDGIPRFLF